MVAGVVVLVAASHDPQRGGHGALTRGQDHTHQQQLGFLPGRVGEQHCEGGEYRYNDIGQGEHGWTFREKSGQHRLPCLYTFLKMRKVQISQSSKGRGRAHEGKAVYSHKRHAAQSPMATHGPHPDRFSIDRRASSYSPMPPQPKYLPNSAPASLGYGRPHRLSCATTRSVRQPLAPPTSVLRDVSAPVKYSAPVGSTR